MIPKECKRLAEVDFPIAAVSRHSAREKGIRQGLPSALHLWWARRPLAACRAILMALLLPDPANEHCPPEFREKASRALEPFSARLNGIQIHELPQKHDDLMHRPKLGSEVLRDEILRFIADFANWDNASRSVYLETAHALVKAAHGNDPPLVVDPFAGGGSIPLEALRLGCDAFASDLNPIACLINKVLLEDIPRHSPDLAQELRRAGAEIKTVAEKQLTEFYPVDADGARPIAYLWARTVQCEAPNCGAEIPLMRSFWLCKKKRRKRALRTKVVRPAKGVPSVEFEVFEPRTEKDVRTGTVSRAKATCVCCNAVLSPDRVRAQLAAQRGGADVTFDSKGNRTRGARLVTVATLQDTQSGRNYRLSRKDDYRAVWMAQQRVKELSTNNKPNGLSSIPDEATPVGGGSGAGRAFSYHRYGMTHYRDLFTQRQLLSLHCFAELIRQNHAFSLQLALVLGKLVDLSNANCRWEPVNECPRNVFAAGRVKAAWEFAEGVTISYSSGGFATCLDNMLAGMCSVQTITKSGSIQIAAAQQSPLPTETAAIWFTDPPYYDAYPYADLSDVFLVWIRRSIQNPSLLQDPFDPQNPLSPKETEATQDESRTYKKRPKDRAFFEQAMALSFAEAHRVLDPSGIAAIVFAHKTTEGWEALLSGIIGGGLTITSSWPIATEQAHRLRAKDSAALATSVHLICRRRPEDAPVGDWGYVLRELPQRVRAWMERLQREGVRGADLVFACIGPALEIFSRYTKVVDAEEREIPLGGDPEAHEAHKRGYLAFVWEVVGRMALEQVLGTPESRARNGGAGALEEDARLTALFLWTLQATTAEAEPDEPETDEDLEEPEADDEDEPPSGKKKKGLSLPFDVARRFAQPLGIHLDVWQHRIIETEKGVVRLIPVLDRAKQLFGDDGAEAVADRLEKHSTGSAQMTLFADWNAPQLPAVRARRRKAAANVSDESLRKHRGATTLDHVHAAILLQASGRANALRALLKSEIERGPDFLRLANALSALYPPTSDEKRLLDAMLLAVPR